MVFLLQRVSRILQQPIKRQIVVCGKFNYSVAANGQEVVVEKLQGNQEGITVLGLNRPEAKNAFSKSLVSCFKSIIADLKKDNGSRVVILRSLTPGIFCAGADLKERKTMSQEEVLEFVTDLRGLLISIEQLPMPTIAALDGAALGGGLEMALACDMRTASDSAKMGLVETKLAIIPGAGGTQRLPRILSPSLAKELIFTSRVLNGKEAKEMGIVNHVVQQNDSKDAAFQKALEIAEEIIPNGPIGVRMAKLAIDKGVQVDLNTGYSIEQVCYDQVIPTKDRLEGLQAFAEKRQPVYRGEWQSTEGNKNNDNASQEEHSKNSDNSSSSDSPKWRKHLLTLTVIVLILWLQVWFILAFIIEYVIEAALLQSQFPSKNADKK